MTATALRLRVLDGPQRGASVRVPDVGELTIGSAFDADVSLRERGLGANALTLSRDADGACRLTARVPVADARVDDVALDVGETRPLAPGATLGIGGTRLVLVPEVDEAAASPDGATAEHAANDAPAVGDDARRAPPRRRRALAIALPSLVLAAAAGAWFWQQHVAANDAPGRPSLSAVVEGSEFSGLRVVEGDGVARVEGFVATRAEAIRLDALLVGLDAPIELDVVVGESLAGAVENVYRLHGVEARVRAIGRDAVDVRTRLGDPERLARLERAVRDDVPGLARIELVDEAPPAPADDTGRSGPTDIGKRVAMVVSGASPHILTEDGSRYFVGATLPNGQRIRAIEGSTVTFDRNGATTRLSF